MKYIRRFFYLCLFRYLRVNDLYNKIVVEKPHAADSSSHRAKIVSLLTTVNEHNPFFKDTFTQFLSQTAKLSDTHFFQAYRTLPIFDKKDYIKAGSDVMNKNAWKSIEKNPLNFNHGVLNLFQQVRRGDFSFSMATGGSSSSPMRIFMDKTHSFIMLFSFFRCWYEMGWRPGDKLLIFYPNKIYDLENYVKNNHYHWLTGVKFILFDELNRASITELVNVINDFKPNLMMIFPSTLNIAAYLIQKNNLKLHFIPPLINVSGETYFDCQRENIEKAFHGCKIEDSYGSVELGEIAHETKPGIFTVFENLAYVETISSTNDKQEIVVTTYYDSGIFPFIRFRMGDILDVAFQKNHHYYIHNINGKDTNYLQFKSQRLFPLDLNTIVNQVNKEIGGIIDIQVVKKINKKISLYIISGEKSDETAIKKLLQEKISQLLHIDTTEIQCELVNMMDHDYRLKYRVIKDESGETEFAGGIIGDAEKLTGLL